MLRRRSMRMFWVVVFLCSFFNLGSAVTLHVPGDYSTIQEAIDSAMAGDTVLVAPGTYVEGIDFLGKAITVKSSDGAGKTVIDANGYAEDRRVVTFESSEGNDSVLDGFTITNGYVDSGDPGAGIFCHGSSPTIINNRIMNNLSRTRGGGIGCLNDASPIIRHNIIGWNRVTNYTTQGAGIYCEQDCTPIIEHNKITCNTLDILGSSGSSGGGGIYCIASFPTIRNNEISWNTLDDGKGGGILCIESIAVIENNVISGNFSTYGGGIYWIESEGSISSNIISSNTAYNGGGGITCYYSSPIIHNNRIMNNRSEMGDAGGINCGQGSPTITNNFIHGNNTDREGGGIYCDFSSFPILMNNTIIGNRVVSQYGSGGGIWCSSHLEIVNNILWDNQAIEGPEITMGVELTIHHSLVKGGKASIDHSPGSVLHWGDGMVDADPQFVDYEASDFHLTYGSPCRNQGDSTSVTDLLDFEGDPRIAQDCVDIGADEFHPHVYCPSPVLPNGDADVRIVGFPMHFSQVFVGIDTLATPRQTPYGLWHLLPPVSTLNLGDHPWNGIYSLHSRIPLGMDPSTVFMQGFNRGTLSNLCPLDVLKSHYEPAAMVPIPGGEFEMGDHHDNIPACLPVHTVHVDAFQMDVFEVTLKQYCDFLNDAIHQGRIVVTRRPWNDPDTVDKSDLSVSYCMIATSSDSNGIRWDGNVFDVKAERALFPMTEVSWYGAVAYANWRSARDGVAVCYDLETWECNLDARGFRLPTEAEWELAARGGEHNPYRRYPWGNGVLKSNANYNSSNDPYEDIEPATTPVGYYDGNQIPSGVNMANGYGLYDMGGNVFEWCNDWLDTTYYSYSPYENPPGPSTGNSRILRGGSWEKFAKFMRVALRSSNKPDDMGEQNGFRLVLKH